MLITIARRASLTLARSCKRGINRSPIAPIHPKSLSYVHVSLSTRRRQK